MADDTLRDILLRIESRLDGHDKRFDDIDQRFDSIDQRFEANDRRFDSMDQRFDSMDQRFESMEERFESMEERFEAMDQRSETLEQSFGEQRVQLNTLTEFTVTSLNSIDGELKTLNHRVLKLELSFEDFRSDSRAYWEQLSDTRTTIAEHEKRLSRLEAG